MNDVVPRTVLIVDEDVLTALELSHTLAESGFAVLGRARTMAGARKLLRVRLPAAALVGARLAGGEDGLALALDLQAADVRVVLTGTEPVDGWTGPFLLKPFGGKSAADLLAHRPPPPAGGTWLRAITFE
jgi:hypothetical protein